MHLREFIKQIENDEISPVTGDDTFGFYCQPSDQRFPEPRPAADYNDDGLLNYPYQRTPSTKNKTHPINDAVETALQTGWILTVPADIVIHTPESTQPKPIVGESFKNTDYVQNYGERLPIHTSETIFTINTRWYVDVPDGYSVFYTTPANFTDSRFKIMPGVVDADEFPLQISVPVIPLEPDCKLRSGLPLIHVYPFKRDDYTISARTGILEPEQQKPER